MNAVGNRIRLLSAGMIGLTIVLVGVIVFLLFKPVGAGPTSGTCLPTSKGGTGCFDDSFWDKIYPVGSIYMSVDSTNPGTKFGGTWVEWGSGQVPIGVDTLDSDFNTIEKTGGVKTSSASSSGATTTGGTGLTLDQMPRHYHYTATSAGTSISFPAWAIIASTSTGNAIVSRDATTTGQVVGHSTYTGNGASHTHPQAAHTHTAQTIVQPYITVFMWKRTN